MKNKLKLLTTSYLRSYEFFQSKDAQAFPEFYKHMTVSFEDVSIPLVVIKTPDRGLVPVMLGDLAIPALRNKWHATLQLGQLSNCGQVRVIQKGLPERVITNLVKTQVMNRFKRFSRYYDRTGFKCFTAPPDERLLELMQCNGQKWATKNNTFWDNSFAYLNLNNLVLDCNIAGHELVWYYGLDEKLFAVAEIVREGDTLHWVNTYQDNTFGRAGNTVLLNLLSQYMGTSTRFNMGIDIFDYKKLWTPDVEYVKGFELVT